MASLDMLLESLNKEEEETTNNKKTSRRVPDRTISGDTLDSIKNHRRSNFKAPPSPAIAGTASRRTSMSRRGARRPSRAGAAGTGMTQGGGGGGALETYVESMNESQRSLNTEDKDPAEDTVDSRQLVAETLPRARKAHNNNNNNNNISNTSGRAIVEEDDDDGPNNKGDGRK